MAPLPLLRLTPSGGKLPIVFNWGVSSFFGWGVYGLNLLLSLADHPGYAPFSAIGFGPDQVVLDPLREARLAALAPQSRELWDALLVADRDIVEVDAPVLSALGTDLWATTAMYRKDLIGRPPIGVVFLEEATLSRAGRQRADQFAVVVAGCSWTERVLREQGIVMATTVLQGVDTSLFHPAPRANVLPGRFVIFSGGKLEYRKGQDLVLAAFLVFHQRHAEALLMCAWHSPWSVLSETAVGLPALSSPALGNDGTPDVLAWAVANGIPADAVIALGPGPNIAMPHVMREADVALFPNRCEGGTNLVAMECMACGIPTILSANTGHLDLLCHEGIALPLTLQPRPVRDGVDTTDWGESDVEEIVEKLEQVWRDREEAAAMGQRSARFMAGMTWRNQTNLLLRAIEPVFP